MDKLSDDDLRENAHCGADADILLETCDTLNGLDNSGGNGDGAGASHHQKQGDKKSQNAEFRQNDHPSSRFLSTIDGHLFILHCICSFCFMRYIFWSLYAACCT